MKSQNEFKGKFPEHWLCPYCMTEVEEEKKCLVDREEIPKHLSSQHEWDLDIDWEYIYNRMIMVGGI